MKLALASWLVIDSSNLVYRQFYGSPKSLSYRGQPTGAIAGTASVLMKKALPMARSGGRLVWARESRSSWRADLEASYKAQRPPMPEGLRSQLGPIAEFATAFGAVSIAVEGSEADDVAAAVCERHGAEGVDVLSDDKDLFQLVTPTVHVVRPKGAVVDEAAVVDALGVQPGLVPDYLALVGDAVDNIPGVKGIGPKSAAKLLQQFGDLEAVLDRAPAEAPTALLRAKIRDADRAAVLRAKQLTTLDRHCALPPDYCPPTPPPVDWARLETLADAYGLRAFKSRLLKEARRGGEQ